SPHGSGTEVLPSPPDERAVGGVVRPGRRHSQPQIPVQAFAHWWGVLRSLNALRPPLLRTISPHVQVGDFSKNSGPDYLNAFARLISGHTLRAHLSRQALFLGEFGHPPGFFDAPGERLLTINMFAHFHC